MPGQAAAGPTGGPTWAAGAILRAPESNRRAGPWFCFTQASPAFHGRNLTYARTDEPIGKSCKGQTAVTSRGPARLRGRNNLTYAQTGEPVEKSS